MRPVVACIEVVNCFGNCKLSRAAKKKKKKKKKKKHWEKNKLIKKKKTTPKKKKKNAQHPKYKQQNTNKYTNE
eukprot:NODE_15166_length_1064_cov_10.572038.p6 GENE.NODE_15166_length_1064_cov_10.572038~~NODE_15166_length_1064_cov_10.572038.p6  ORF type:complete len:73 (+),score=42.59 NODE_15166_length_1064_cov_10.572038:833-1051(+)